jgi:two-component system, NarL family, response regulator LiaR
MSTILQASLETQTTALIQVFLVEDHPMTLAGLKLTLEQDPTLSLVGEATNGRSAVEAIVGLPVGLNDLPLVILMDIGLPLMDGIEATLKIKATRPQYKVLMLTSKDSEADVFAAMAAGADAYCMKGISLPALSSAISAVADGAAWLDPAVAKLVLGRFQQTMPPTAVGQLAQGVASGTAKAVPCPLTARELEVLKLIVDGLSNPEIAGKLFITQATAKAHVHSILQKLCVDDRTQAAVLAMRQGYV